MFICCFVLVSVSWPIVAAVARYYVILRLPNTSVFQETSAQFKLLQPHNDTGWDCRSGPNPIQYPSGADHVISAKSIDLEVDAEVECLGLSVRVVVGENIKMWRDECQGCRGECPGFLTSTSELERSVSETTLYFQLTPTTIFQVYSAEPTEECARRQLQHIPPPTLAFTNNTSCYVTARDALSCNMSLTAEEDDVIATATFSTEIQVPRFIWDLGIRTIRCSCACRIQQTETESGVVRRATLVYANPQNVSANTPEPYSSQAPARGGVSLIVVCVVAVLLFFSTTTAIFFINFSRTLNRRLGRMRAPDLPPFHGERRGVGSIRSECHHYNTVSLRLADCVELSRQYEYERPPIYQKLSRSGSVKF